MKRVRFIVDVWIDDEGKYTAVAHALHIAGAEARAESDEPGEAAKQALHALIDQEAQSS
jgi:hypothetical protein